MNRIAFLLFLGHLGAGYSGFIEGRDAVLQDPDQQKIAAASRSTVILARDGRVFLRLSFGEGSEPWLYDVERNVFVGSGGEPGARVQEARSLQVPPATLQGLLGGTPWRLAELQHKLRSEPAGAPAAPAAPAALDGLLLKAATVLNGHYGGRYLGVELTRAQFRQELFQVLRDPVAGREVRGLVVGLIYRQHRDQMESRMRAIERGEIALPRGVTKAELAAAMQDFGNPDAHYRARHFRHLLYLVQ